MRWTALMPLRGGSKSIPGKNLQRIAGKPLYAWSLEQALDSRSFDEVVVATDAETIRDSVQTRFGPAVTVIGRSPETATDNASSESVMLEYQRHADFDVLALIQATSPLTEARHFTEARQQFETDGLDSLLTAVELKRFFWQQDGTPINYDPRKRPRRQAHTGTLVENGAFYFTHTRILEQQGCRLGGKIGIYQMPRDTYLELDEPDDIAVMERLLIGRKIRGGCQKNPQPVRALVLDVDGTLTDGGMYYDATGEKLKKFNTRDAMGLELLRRRGIRVCIITGENSPITEARIRKLQITDYYPGVKDKPALLEKLVGDWQIPMQQIVFVGDDRGDVSCLCLAGVSFCPADAHPEALAEADFVCSCNGGGGAVREVCDLILSAIAQ